MYRIKASIKGLAPLRYNRYLEQSKESANKKKMTHEQQKEDAFRRSYYDDKNGFYIPSKAISRCIVNGGKKVKVGRGSASALLNAIMIFEEDKFFIGTKKYEIEQDAVRIPPKTGARVTQYWVIIPKWECNFSAVILDDVFPSEAAKEAIQFAGMYYGLLDGRPQLGRFELVGFKKEKVE